MYGENDNRGRRLADFVLPPDHLDLTIFNVIERGLEIVPIDMEWVLNRGVPLGWVVTRSVLNALVTAGGGEETSIGIADVIMELSSRHNLCVSRQEIVEWLGWEAELQAAVTGRVQKPVAVSACSFQLVSPRRLVAQRDIELATLTETSNKSLAERDIHIAVLNEEIAKSKCQTSERQSRS